MNGSGINFTQLLYRPIFDRLAVSAVLIPASKDGQKFAFDVLDKTEGVALPQQGGMILETVKPSAELMMSDVLSKGLTRDDLSAGTIVIFPPGVDTSDIANGRTWQIISYRMNQSPSGEADGTVYLHLESGDDA